MSNYAWMIDVDHEREPDKPEGSLYNAKGLFGPRRIKPEQKEALIRGEGTPFKMFDDDDNLIYEGRLVGDSESEDGFGPLEDFGMPNFGCTRIEYRRRNLDGSETWKTL